MLNLFVGYDPKEAVAYHAFCHSVLTKSSLPVSFTPLHLPILGRYREKHTDGSNAFIYSRFLVPHLMGYRGWAIYADGDMVCEADIADLWALRDESKAVMVVKHDYETKFPVKYLGAKNPDYPRKNWSSLILWNCGHPANAGVGPSYVERQSGRALHRFEHLKDHEIGELPAAWNWLVSEYPHNDEAKLYHYTIGTPCFSDYYDCDHAARWHLAHKGMNECQQ